MEASYEYIGPVAAFDPLGGGLLLHLWCSTLNSSALTLSAQNPSSLTPSVLNPLTLTAPTLTLSALISPGLTLPQTRPAASQTQTRRS